MESFDIIGYTSVAGPPPGQNFDVGALTTRIGRLLRRDDLDGEIVFWLNYAYQTLCDRVNFWELRTLVTYSLTATVWKYDLPADFMRVDRAYYKATASSNPVWGRNLWPLPREWYADAELERRENTGSQAKGDLLHYLIDGNQVIFYPVPLYTGNTVEFTYYHLPVQLINSSDQPEIAPRYRHYLIWLAYFWGQVFLEKQDPNKIMLWERKFNQTINDVKRVVEKRENRARQILAPITGTEGGDKIYGGG